MGGGEVEGECVSEVVGMYWWVGGDGECECECVRGRGKGGPLEHIDHNPENIPAQLKTNGGLGWSGGWGLLGVAAHVGARVFARSTGGVRQCQ